MSPRIYTEQMLVMISKEMREVIACASQKFGMKKSEVVRGAITEGLIALHEQLGSSGEQKQKKHDELKSLFSNDE